VRRSRVLQATEGARARREGRVGQLERAVREAEKSALLRVSAAVCTPPELLYEAREGRVRAGRV